MAGKTHHRKPPLPLLYMNMKILPAKVSFVVGVVFLIISGIKGGIIHASGGGVNLISVRPKILSLGTRGDGLNDRVIFRFAPEPESKLTLKIFPLGDGGGMSAAREINYNFDGSGYITWDGRANGNYFVQPGIYIYQIEADGKIFNGTVVVAR